eukprot:TRINITY_DN19766_c0_g1_i1.p1 TRINITY_DN19766_c0_g1~~TRINITY_DN19766_c0_g1_i1.p1  ORF type:complete len:103 (-),score=12.10 TRINITY_DN19766_c0_g1_i1:42-350(-)
MVKAIKIRGGCSHSITSRCQRILSELDYGKSVQYELKKGRQAYLVCPEGSLTVNGQVELETRAAVRLYGEALLDIVATQKVEPNETAPSAHFMMIEMEIEQK